MKTKLNNAEFRLVPPADQRLQNLVPFPIQIVTSADPIRMPEDSIRILKGEATDVATANMSQTGVWNSIQDDPEVLSHGLPLSARLIQGPQVFFENPTREILIPQLNDPSSQTNLSERRWKFRSTAEKNLVMKMVAQFINDIPGAHGVTETILAIADELFTNALFNAPFDDLDSTLDRSTLVVLDAEMSAELIIGHTKDKIFLGCTDAYGTLNCERLIKRIFNGFKDGISSALNMERGGAGIGMLRMVDLSAHIFVLVERNKKTLIGCGFPLNRSPKKIRTAPKNFYFQSYHDVTFKGGKMRVERR